MAHVGLWLLLLVSLVIEVYIVNKLGMVSRILHQIMEEREQERLAREKAMESGEIIDMAKRVYGE